VLAKCDTKVKQSPDSLTNHTLKRLLNNASQDILHEPPGDSTGERIAKRLGVDLKTIHNHLGKMATFPFFLNSDLERGFTIAQVAEKHGWT